MVAFALPVHAYDAEIIALVGQGESRASIHDKWTPSYVTQQLNAGAFVRTGELSQMSLLLRDRTQLRLTQNSMAEIKKLATTNEPTRIELPRGRVWMQLKRHQAALDPLQPPTLLIETPNATAAIRGTSWEINVAGDGNTTLLVFDGTVDFYNDFGHVQVTQNEQAHVAPGQAPSKILLTQTNERVQWVTAYRPQPHRWAAEDHSLDSAISLIENGQLAIARAQIQASPYSPLRARLLADLALFEGDSITALALLEPYPEDPLSLALRVRAYLIAGDLPAAEQTVNDGVMKFPTEIEIQLAAGDVARFKGSYPEANNAFNRAKEIDASNSEAWFGIGRIANAREDVHHSRLNLNQAITLNPDGLGYRGELGTLETFANNFGAAQPEFAQALKATPDDYIALTGQAILRLKEGKADEGLQLLLKATLIEPRFARAVLYTAVAYYQLGYRHLAHETFLRAIALDPNDPLPYMMITLVADDSLDHGLAIDSAQDAINLLPRLHSLNQVLINQKGNTNLGYALSQFGFEEWAQSYAYKSYTPYWAGSQLFLADRYPGAFTHHSELLRGFISDPMVLGASNSFNTLIPRPGDYFSVQGILGSGDMKTYMANLTANGYHITPFPTSYFINFERPWVKPQRQEIDGNNRNWTIGLGARPDYDLTLFLFASASDTDGKGTLSSSLDSLTASSLTLNDQKVDLGASYRISPTNMLWFKAAYNKENIDFYGDIVSPYLARRLSALSGLTLNDSGEISINTDMKQHEFAMRHTFDLSSKQELSWGIEQAVSKTPIRALSHHLPGPLPLPIDFSMRNESFDVYVSNRFKPDKHLLVQADLGYQHFKHDDAISFNVGNLKIDGIPFSGNSSRNSWLPRLGLAWEPNRGQTLRLAYQDWRRPASVGTLAPIDTVGIVIDEYVTKIGGELQQSHIRYDWEIDRRNFLQAFVQHQEIDNLPGSIDILPINDLRFNLDRLRNSKSMFNQRIDFWEMTPGIDSGRIDRVGIAYNHLLTPKLSTVARYWYSEGKNTSYADSGDTIPWMPRHWLQLSTHWVPLPRLQFDAIATYRSRRYADADSYASKKAGWTFGLHSYWESSDKRWSVEAMVDNIHGNQDNSAFKGVLYGLQATYRF